MTLLTKPYRFYATWCKSCQKFGQKYRHLAFEEGDHVNIEGETIHTGNVRFAEAEYSASAKLCKSLKVKKLPTVHMYKRGRGKVSDMTVKPSLFHLVVDELHRVLDTDDDNLEGDIEFETDVDKVPSNVNVTSTSFDEMTTSLGDEIMSSLQRTKKAEEKEPKKKEKNWFFTG